MKNRNMEELLNNFYSNYDEDIRLIKDKAGNIEFITTTTYIDKYLKPNHRILEIGAGTGRYSLYYANKGYQVDALELVKHNLDIINSNINKKTNIKTIQGNALDLSMYQDNTFDITLLLGPLYHLFTKEEQEKAINEAIRVTKKNGIIFMAFILYDASIVNFGFVDNEIKLEFGENKHINTDYTPNNKEEFLFNNMYFKDVKNLISNFKVKVLHYVASDGISKIIQNTVNEMDKETYNHFINYHLSTCEREDLIGYSAHILVIVEKK